MARAVNVIIVELFHAGWSRLIKMCDSSRTKRERCPFSSHRLHEQLDPVDVWENPVLWAGPLWMARYLSHFLLDGHAAHLGIVTWCLLVAWNRMELVHCNVSSNMLTKIPSYSLYLKLLNIHDIGLENSNENHTRTAKHILQLGCLSWAALDQPGHYKTLLWDQARLSHEYCWHPAESWQPIQWQSRTAKKSGQTVVLDPLRALIFAFPIYEATLSIFLHEKAQLELQRWRAAKWRSTCLHTRPECWSDKLTPPVHTCWHLGLGQSVRLDISISGSLLAGDRCEKLMGQRWNNRWFCAPKLWWWLWIMKNSIVRGPCLWHWHLSSLGWFD